MKLRWQELVSERAKLADIPAGAVDPTERQRQIDDEADAIEYDLGEIMRRENREADA